MIQGIRMRFPLQELKEKLNWHTGELHDCIPSFNSKNQRKRLNY